MKWTPSDVAAERAVAAAVLLSAGALDDVVELLSPNDIIDPLARGIIEAAMACEANGEPIDIVTVTDEMKRRKALKREAGYGAVSKLVEEYGFAIGNVEAHCKIIADKSKLRAILSTAKDMAGDVTSETDMADDIQQRAEERIFAIGERGRRSSLTLLGEAVTETLEEIARNRTRGLLGCSTGFKELDRLTKGFQSGQLVVLAARPGIGKSAMALQIAHHVAKTGGAPVAFLSYEMSKTELTTRLLAARADFPLGRMMGSGGALEPGEDEKLMKAALELSETPLYIDDTPPQTIAGVRSAMRRLARRTELSMVVVDYLQLLESERRNKTDMSRAEEVSEISRGLKRLAVELSVPVLALSQLNRGVENRENKRPLLSDLRESGSIEQDASLVLMLYRDKTNLSNPRAAELMILKQRNGVAGVTVPLDYDGPTTKFIDTGEAARSSGAAASNPVRDSQPGYLRNKDF